MPWKATPLEDRLWARVDKNGPLRRPMKTRCWQWTGATQRGYGSIHVGTSRKDKKMRQVHVVVWEILVGPIPAGLTLDHLCRNRACVRPSHLQPVTNKVNVLRGRGLTAVNARKTHCKRGHEFTPENTRVNRGSAVNGYGPFRSCRTCEKLRASGAI